MTLVQGSDPESKRYSDYPANYTAPANFANQMSDPRYPLYLNPSSYNPLLDLHEAQPGIEAFAIAVGLRPRDLFGTCLVVALGIIGGIALISVLLWGIHALFELFSSDTRQNRSTAFSHSPQPSLGGKEAFEPRGFSWDYDSSTGQVPPMTRRATATAPSWSRRVWLRFRPRGEAGAFHLAALYGNLVRVILIFHLPITAFSMYQLTLSEASVVSRVFAALAFAFISVLIPALLLFKIQRTPSGKLHDATRTLLSLGPMYNVYLEERQMFRAYLLGASLIEGIVVGAGQKSGLAQGVVFIVVEIFMLVFPVIWYPWGEGAGMGAPTAFIGIIRVASTVLTLLLAKELAMARSTRDWIAYVALILQAVVFVFFLLMLLVKLVEGLIRLFGGAHFDESTSPLDSGLFAAIMDLDCFNGVRGGKAAARKRRKRGSRQLQQNVHAAGSLTTQMMLDRHSQGVPRDDDASPYGSPPYTPIGLPVVNSVYGNNNQLQPPLGPPPDNERRSSESRSEPSASGHIMDAWSPHQPGIAAGGYALAPQLSPPIDAANAPTRSFSVIRGGRADFENPYDVKPGSGPGRAPPVILQHAAPGPSRQSSYATTGGYITGTSTPIGPVATLNSTAPGVRPNSQGLQPPPLTIPKRRSLNDIKGESSPDSGYSPTTESKHKKGKKRIVSGWTKKEPKPKQDADSEDDEPGPPRRAIKPFEPVPVAIDDDDDDLLSPKRKGWRPALFGRKKKEEDEFASLARDENKARKAALANESGSLLAGVESPPTAPSSFSVKRRGGPTPTRASELGVTNATTPTPATRVQASTPTPPPESSAAQRRTFTVKRMGQRTPEPVLVSDTPEPRSTEPKTTAPNVAASARPSTETNASMSPLAGATARLPSTPTPSGQGQGQGQGQAARTFKVLNRPGPSPMGSRTSSDGASASGGFRVNRLRSYEYTPTEREEVVTSPSGQEQEGVQSMGYPPTSFIPIDEVRDQSPMTSLNDARAQAFGAPLRPVKSPRRSIDAQRQSQEAQR